MWLCKFGELQQLIDSLPQGVEHFFKLLLRRVSWLHSLHATVNSTDTASQSMAMAIIVSRILTSFFEISQGSSVYNGGQVVTLMITIQWKYDKTSHCMKDWRATFCSLETYTPALEREFHRPQAYNHRPAPQPLYHQRKMGYEQSHLKTGPRRPSIMLHLLPITASC